MKYELSAQVTISIYTDVEADSLEKAIEIAKERALMSILSRGGESEDDTWMSSELDGVPFNIDKS